ncbi:virulence factor [Sanguibacter gelidistatuariae]|uniref:Virulence factor n=1 Tax=Sanguibacter gelidistatuariae TaxID=1814289 RepID=A0A1G6GRZ5_9MICO|nr:Gfo/Idh/MocA family oxidoreductase [Sanguibacter gelidistatuariae]SDB84744.1 virulence factor [Sanguibacter gelidistatuariae]
MRAAIIGVGDIARKAYLPVLCADPRLTPVLVTRSASVRDDVARAYRIEQAFASVTEAIRAGLDVAFVHAATVAHAEILAELIAAGVHVYVDKPIDDSAAGAARLAEAARSAGVSLAVGFNRRFAPEYAALAAWADRDTIVLGKHRYAAPSPRVSEVAAGRTDDDRSLVFDDFIHVLDSLRFLGAEGADGVDVSARREDGQLRRIEVVLRDGQRRATGLMDRDSGATVEELDVFAPGRRARVRDLAEVTEYAGGSVTVRRRQEWVSVGEQRGFAGAVGAFVDAVAAGRVLDAADAVRTHELCEEVVGQLSRI